MSTAFPLCLRLLEHGRFSGVSPPLAPPRTLLVGPSTPLLEAADNMDYLATRGPQSPRIVRPSTAQTPLSMLRMGELIQEAGIPAGDLFFSFKKKNRPHNPGGISKHDWKIASRPCCPWMCGSDSPRRPVGWRVAGAVNIIPGDDACGAGPHNMDYNPTRWPQSPRIVMQCAT